MTDIQISSLENRLRLLKDQFNQRKGKYETLLESKDKKTAELNKAKIKHERLLKARTLFMETAKQQRNQIKREFEKIVTQALQYVRNEEIYFEIDIDEKRGRAEADFYIKSVRDGITTRSLLSDTSLKDSRGDGVSSLVRIALSIALLELSKQEGPLVSDEPAKEVSAEYLENTAALLKHISVVFKRQIIMSTHIDLMANVADKKFKFSLNGTETLIEII